MERQSDVGRPNWLAIVCDDLRGSRAYTQQTPKTSYCALQEEYPQEQSCNLQEPLMRVPVAPKKVIHFKVNPRIR
jgi:hypothetical protein